MKLTVFLDSLPPKLSQTVRNELRLCANKTEDSEMLATLTAIAVEAEDDNLAYAVAKNVYTRKEDLSKLAEEGKSHWHVRKAVAENESTGVEDIVKLLEDREDEVRDSAIARVKKMLGVDTSDDE